MLYCNRLVDRHISPFSVLLALGLTERERAKAVKPGGTVYTCGMPFLIHKGGVVRYRSTDRWEKLFKARTDESVAALEAIAADLGLAAGTPRTFDAAEGATHAETSALSRPASQSGDKAKRSPEVNTGAREPSRQGDGRQPDGTIPLPAKRRSPWPSSLLLPSSLAHVQRPSDGKAEPSQRSMRSGPSATLQPTEESALALRKARNAMGEIERLQQKAESDGALSPEDPFGGPPPDATADAGLHDHARGGASPDAAMADDRGRL